MRITDVEAIMIGEFREARNEKSTLLQVRPDASDPESAPRARRNERLSSGRPSESAARVRPTGFEALQ